MVWPAGRQVLYIVDVPSTLSGSGLLVVEVATRERRKTDGQWGKPKTHRIPVQHLAYIPEALDRQILAMLLGAKEYYNTTSYTYNTPYPYASTYYQETAPIRYQLPETVQHLVLPLMCQSGRCWLRTASGLEEHGLEWDEGEPWHFSLDMQRDTAHQHYVITGCLQRQGPDGVERMGMAEPVMLTNSGWLFTTTHVARLEHGGAFAWIPPLRQHGAVLIPCAQGQAFLAEFLRLPYAPRLQLPEELQYEEVALAPAFQIVLRVPDYLRWMERVCGEVSFDYGGTQVSSEHPGSGIYDAETRRLVRRDQEAEREALAVLRQLGFKPERFAASPTPVLTLSKSLVPRMVRELVGRGWQVEAEGKLYRRPGVFHLQVNSGIDWFELHGSVDFEGVTAQLPALLKALQRGEHLLRLDDGTYGLLPEEWLKQYGALAGLGTATEDHVRFTRAQTGLLDALLATQPAVTWDETFAKAREALKRFEGIAPADPPATFQGELRGYQREGLGWIHFLRTFGFGGCLADDMGLGKTVQVLALLATRRAATSAGGKAGQRLAPSLVVVPKSLVFNWQQEAARFTPHPAHFDRGCLMVRSAWSQGRSPVTRTSSSQGSPRLQPRCVM